MWRLLERQFRTLFSATELGWQQRQHRGRHPSCTRPCLLRLFWSALVLCPFPTPALAPPLLPPQVCVRCEEINISGGMVRQKAKYERFLRKRSVTNPRRGAVKFRCVRATRWLRPGVWQVEVEVEEGVEMEFVDLVRARECKCGVWQGGAESAVGEGVRLCQRQQEEWQSWRARLPPRMRVGENAVAMQLRNSSGRGGAAAEAGAATAACAA